LFNTSDDTWKLDKNALIGKQIITCKSKAKLLSRNWKKSKEDLKFEDLKDGPDGGIQSATLGTLRPHLHRMACRQDASLVVRVGKGDGAMVFRSLGVSTEERYTWTPSWE